MEFIVKSPSCTETGLLMSRKNRELEETGQLRVVELERSQSDLTSIQGVLWIKQDSICKTLTKCLGQLNAYYR